MFLSLAIIKMNIKQNHFALKGCLHNILQAYRRSNKKYPNKVLKNIALYNFQTQNEFLVLHNTLPI